MLQQAATKSPPELVTIVVYDVPNRDCASNNSVGDICCYYYPDGSCNREKDGDCSAGRDLNNDLAQLRAAVFAAEARAVEVEVVAVAARRVHLHRDALVVVDRFLATLAPLRAVRHPCTHECGRTS